MDRPWFNTKNFTSLEIRKNKSLSDHTVVKAVTIIDAEYIGQLASRIEKMSPNGDMMISFSGAAEHIELIFYSGEEGQEIDIIQKGFKTPSTGFNIKDEYEKEVYAEIDALLFPAIEKIVPKVKGLRLDFGGFSLCYKGIRYEDLAPVTLSFHIDEFVVGDNAGKIRSVEISAGQLPPKPFVIEEMGLVLLTFHSKSEKRMYPDFFQVVKGDGAME
jgi:hypothetical protein